MSATTASKPARRLAGASRRLRAALLLLLLWPAAAGAAVEIGFWTKDQDKSFPHAFIVLEGTIDATGTPVSTNYGFTAKRVSPAVLLGPVTGEIITVGDAYVSRAQRHFSLVLSDEEYGRVTDIVRKWQSLEQPSYRLNSRNCIHFAAEVAAALGLKADPIPKLMKKPRSFFQRVTADNQTLIAEWSHRTAVRATASTQR